MKSRKRIAFIINSVFPYRLSFYEKLHAHEEYDWMFFHGVKQVEDGRPAYRGDLNFPNQPVGYAERKVGPFFIRWQAGVCQHVKKWQPQIVITQGIPSIVTNWLVMYWAHRNDAKTIVWHCGWEAQAENSRSLAVKQCLARRYLQLADHTVVYSTKGLAYLEALGYESHKLTISYNGLETDHLLVREAQYREKGSALRAQSLSRGKKLFLYVGGMMAEKQVPLLLDAYKLLDDGGNAALWLVGDGPDLGRIKSMAAAKHLKSVQFWGRLIEDVDVLFAAADYFVLPGLGGLALNQALFWGLPCVAGEADGTEDDLVIDGKTGFRFCAKDRYSLAAALGKCMELSDGQRRILGNAGRELVLERSNVNRMVHTFISTIDHLVEAQFQSDSGQPRNRA